MSEPARVLIVEPNDVERDRLSAWLEHAGYDVMSCPGPQTPDYTCIGVSQNRCPLARVADVVVLDMRSAGDDVMHGTTAWELVAFYNRHDARVVAIASNDETIATAQFAGVGVVRRPADEAELLAAVRASASPQHARQRL
jgi:CheY-like chemotaxis protein